MMIRNMKMKLSMLLRTLSNLALSFRDAVTRNLAKLKERFPIIPQTTRDAIKREAFGKDRSAWTPSEGSQRFSTSNLRKVISAKNLFNLFNYSNLSLSNLKVFLLIISISFIIATMGLSCKDEPTKPIPTCTVKLTLDYTECKEIGLKLSFTDSNQPRNYALLRDGQQITSGTLSSTETLLVDTAVVPGRDYTYIAQRLNGTTVIDASTLLPVHSLDSISHAMQWFVDTLGAQGVIRDVWVFDRNNAWAVGEMSIKDSSGQIKYPPYGAAHWDGQKWTYLILSASNPAGYYSYLVPTGIFAFSETDIWLVSGGIHRFNGQQITQSYWVNYFEGNPNPILSSGQTVEKLWGTKNTNIYAVGRGGGTVHFNGSSWSNMPSNTTVDLEDVYGLDENHIWATGTNQDGNSVVLSFDGTQWKTLYDNINKPPLQWFGFSTLWTNRSSVLYLAGGSRLRRLDLKTNSFSNQYETGQGWVTYCVRGTNTNDLFIVAASGECSHFNGASWYLYPELKYQTQDYVYFLTIKIKQDFLLIGGSIFTGMNGFPIVVRGYR